MTTTTSKAAAWTWGVKREKPHQSMSLFEAAQEALRRHDVYTLYCSQKHLSSTNKRERKLLLDVKKNASACADIIEKLAREAIHESDTSSSSDSEESFPSSDSEEDGDTLVKTAVEASRTALDAASKAARTAENAALDAADKAHAAETAWKRARHG